MNRLLDYPVVDSAPTLRRAQQPDWAQVAGICADTGRAGEPVGAAEREAFAERWIGPYREFRPDWTWVAVAGDKVVGYLTGCPDTPAFEAALQRRVETDRFPTDLEAAFPRYMARSHFPPAIRLKLWTEHPAHLHLNVAAGHRGLGTGAALISAYFAQLRKAGVSSVHLICGPSSVPFWERMAFRVEAVVEVAPAAPGLLLRAMTRPV